MNAAPATSEVGSWADLVLAELSGGPAWDLRCPPRGLRAERWLRIVEAHEDFAHSGGRHAGEEVDDAHPGAIADEQDRRADTKERGRKRSH